MRRFGRSQVRVMLAVALVALLGATVRSGPPIVDAAMRGDLDEVRALIQRGVDVNASQGDGMTALHFAAENGDAPMVRTLLAAGAFPDAVTRLARAHAPHQVIRHQKECRQVKCQIIQQ